MKFSYYPETDSLYIELSRKPAADTVRVGDYAVDVDEDGNPVGIDIDSLASEIVDLSKMRFERKSEGSDAVLQLDTGFLREAIRAGLG
ncbi:MAG: hypothetical protein CYG60_08500 [Actinobacteria bacterium]|nr:MAG: hypothetical protein CYG60_08500 [Actinomycetota bacterium]